jgi:glycosyltransferase involved in cell wall biosynthesis
MGYVFTRNTAKARCLRVVVRALMRLAFGGKKSRAVLLNPEDVQIIEQFSIVAPKHIRLIPGAGVDCTRFVAPSNECNMGSGFRVILAARMLWDKGVAEFVEAARMLKTKDTQIQFILAGAPDPGNPAAVPKTVLQDWHAEGVVRWLGHIDDMPALLASADVVVLPSYREGLSTILTEAAACARPLITTNVPGCRDVVTDEVDGLLIPPRDSVALARAVERLKADRCLAKRLGEAARKKALDKFDENIIIEQTLNVYKELQGQII